MSKQAQIIEVISSDLTYLPSAEQRKLKEAFWLRFSADPTCDPSEVTQSIVELYTSDSRVSRWWSQTGFKEWFRNQEEFRERAAILAHLALDTLQSIMINETAQASARVNAAKLVMEIARKMPTKQAVEKYVDEKIAEMDKKQLEAYIAKNIHLLPNPPQKGLTDNNPDARVEKQKDSDK